jgi:hypothetical protein
MVSYNSVDFGDELGDASLHADNPLSLALVRPEPDALVSGASS